MSVFKVDRNYTIILNDDAVKLVPELRSLNQNQLWYVILVADYVDGPFRKLPVQERKLMAVRKIFGRDHVMKESEKVKLALDGYHGLVFDIRRETLDRLKAKVENLHQDLLKPGITALQIQNIDKSISFLEKRIISIEKDLQIEEQEQIEIKGAKKLSMIEIWQRNQMRYSEYKETV